VSLIYLSSLDLALASLLVLILAGLSWRLRLGLQQTLVIAAVRTAVQLTLIGLVLKALFGTIHLGWLSLVALFMLLAAGREVMARQKHRYRGVWGFAIGTTSMFISSFSITVLALVTMVQPEPWYLPQYAIPLLGMMLGNTMNGISLSLDRMTSGAMQQQAIIEARLCLGDNWNEAIADLRRESARTGMIPIINAMAAAGIVSLPGMMTGQILSGTEPVEAVKYQILIMFMITAGTGLGTVTAIWFGSKRLFDTRQRLRLDRLK